MISEFVIEPNTGEHAITAIVEIPEEEKNSVLEWAGEDNTALMDILLLLSLFSGRDVFAGDPISQVGKPEIDGAIIRDSRVFRWGGILRTSIPYKAEAIEGDDVLKYNIGFEVTINDIYELIRSNEWQNKFSGGYYLLLVKEAFRQRNLESTFIQCWTIWEHLFAVLNRQWLSSKEIVQIRASQKIAFMLVTFALQNEIEKNIRSRIEKFVETRNRLIHFGRFPERGSIHKEAVLFIRLTEFIIVKTLNLEPSNVLNTLEDLDKFMNLADPYDIE